MESEEHNGKTILLAMDLSKHCEFAARHYLKHLHQPENLLIFYHTSEPPHIPCTPAALNAEQWEEMLLKQTNKILEIKEVCHHLMAHQQVKYKFDFSEHFGVKPGEDIVRAAEEHGAKLIVIGSRGLGLIRRTILGSVSEYVVHHAAMPVMICHLP